MPPPMLRKQTTQIRVHKTYNGVQKGPLNFEHDIENSSLQGVGHFNKQALVHLPRELLCDGVLSWALKPKPEKSRVLFIATSELGWSMRLLERTSARTCMSQILPTAAPDLNCLCCFQVNDLGLRVKASGLVLIAGKEGRDPFRLYGIY